MLFLLQLMILREALPEPVVRALVAGAILVVVVLQRLVREGLQIKLLFDHQSSLTQTQMSHALQCLLADNPINLCLIQHLLLALALLIHDDEATFSPSLYHHILRWHLNPGSLLDLGRRQPLLMVIRKAAKAKENNESLCGLRVLLPEHVLTCAFLREHG